MVRLCVIFLFCIYEWPVFLKILQYKLSVSCWCLKDNPKKKKGKEKRKKKQADLWFVMLASFHGVNTLIMAHFKCPMWC